MCVLLRPVCGSIIVLMGLWMQDTFFPSILQWCVSCNCDDVVSTRSMIGTPSGSAYTEHDVK